MNNVTRDIRFRKFKILCYLSFWFSSFSHALESYTAIPFNERTPRPANPILRPAYQGSNPISDLWSKYAFKITAKYLKRYLFFKVVIYMLIYKYTMFSTNVLSHENTFLDALWDHSCVISVIHIEVLCFAINVSQHLVYLRHNRVKTIVKSDCESLYPYSYILNKIIYHCVMLNLVEIFTTPFSWVFFLWKETFYWYVFWNTPRLSNIEIWATSRGVYTRNCIILDPYL